MTKRVSVSSDGENWFEVKPSDLESETSIGWWLSYGPRTFYKHIRDDGSEVDLVMVDELKEFIGAK